MIPSEIIIKKRDGHRLTREEIEFFVRGFVSGDIPDYQMSALAMAIFFRDMDPAETGHLVRAMMRSGDVYDLSEVGRPLVDKHSTGGVGDKISLILAPLAAACGLGVPMVSGRGLGHTGGTLDKLESIPGFTVGLDFEEFKAAVKELGVCMIGQTDAFVPADKKLYALRDVTGTVESIPLITSSILSKKFASGAKALVMDVKFGSGAFMKTRGQAEALAEALSGAGDAMNIPVTCVLSDMSEPLGAAVGNTLEVLESLDVLRASGPADVRDLTLRLVAEMLVLGDLAENADEGLAFAKEKLDDGSALRVFRRMIERQGGDPSVVDTATLGWRGSAAKGRAELHLEKRVAGPMRLAASMHTVVAPRGGTFTAVDTRAVGMAALELGAGRRKSSDEVDHGVGIVCAAKVDAKLEKGAPLFHLFHEDGRGLEAAEKRLLSAVQIE